MDEHVGHILYHVLIVIFPVLLYYLFVIQDHRSASVHHKGKLFAAIAIILILCLAFPVEYANGFSFDFRIIPIVMTFLYVGFTQGIILIGIMLGYLYLNGEPRVFILLINYAIISLIFYFLRKKYIALRMSRKLFFLTAIIGGITITRAIMMVKNNEADQLFVMLLFTVITWITLFLVVLIFENLNEQIRLQQEIRRSEKMNLISQLAASVAHEVRNPLTAVVGFLQLMKEDKDTTEKHQKYIDLTLQELHRAQSIINDYLSLAKPNNTRTQLINMSEELEKTIKLMTSYSNIQNIEVQSAVEDELFVTGSKDEIKQVLINIIKNAIEAMGNDGILKIIASKTEQDVIIKIIDNGPGMTKEQLSRIGTPFYSTKEIGTGIGLTICYQIIGKLKGSITVESEIGKGTTFIITLPYANPTPS